MDLSATLITYRRQALLDLIDSGGSAGALALYATPRPAAGVAVSDAPLVSITLAYPSGIVSDSGVALYATAYAQAKVTGNALWARLTTSAGVWVADLSVGIATDNPVPELVLPARKIYAGARVRLGAGAAIVCN